MWVYFWALYSVPLIYISVFVSNVLFWLLKLCSVVWNQKVWYLQLCSSFSGLLWLSRVLLLFHTNLRLLFSIYVKKMPLGFWWGLDWIYRWLYVVWTFHNINSSDPWTQISLYLCLLQFLSAKMCGLHCIDLSLSWLNVFLSILLFYYLLWMRLSSLFLFQVFHC